MLCLTWDTREYRKLISKLKEEPWKIKILSKDEIIEYFTIAMVRSHKQFGKHAFRKSYGDQVRRPINRCLFETWAYIMGRYTDEEFEKLLENQRSFKVEYTKILDDIEFQNAIQRQSMKHTALKYRFNTLIELTDKYAK